MKERDRMCLNKRRYDSEDAAVSAVADLGRVCPYRVYRCHFGGHFHITKQPIEMRLDRGKEETKP